MGINLAEVFPGAMDTGLRSTDREPWLQARRQGWTATDSPALLGVSPNKSALKVHAEKLGLDGGDEHRPEAAREIMRWGLLLEEPILRELGHRLSHDVRPLGALLASREHAGLLATLDGLDLTDGDGVEVKTFSTWGSFVRWDEGLPLHVQIQVQHQLLVTGKPAQWVTFLPLPQRRLGFVKVKAREDFHGYLLEELAKHSRMLEQGDLPEPDGSDSSAEALRDLYPRDDGSVIELGPQWADLTRQYVEARARRLADEKTEKRIKQMLLGSLGVASFGKLPEELGHWSSKLVEPSASVCDHCKHETPNTAYRKANYSAKPYAPPKPKRRKP